MTVLDSNNLAPTLPQACVTLPARFYKRASDVCLALLALSFAFLLMCLIALVIKLTDRGPIFYIQRRLTRAGRAFPMLKFRTMIPSAEPHGPAFAQANDPRCTPVGRWLRATALDELPQLLNVLVGDMSLIGPRPERPELFPQITREIPHFPQRLAAKAGITGWAQVHGYRGNTSFQKRLDLDLFYINHWSPLLDLKILLATFYILILPSKKPDTRGHE
jgi:lipopolysaccharide/colanic/teichoic acid biosynthesis glycosyltransferase